MRDHRTTLGRGGFTDHTRRLRPALRGLAALALAGSLAALLQPSCATGGDTENDPTSAGTKGAGQGGSGGGGGEGTGGAPCTPGEMAECYSGPAATKGVGLCVAGQHTCAADGSGFGPCEGEVTPAADDCMTAEDEDCDGVPAACPGDAFWATRAGDVADQRLNAIAVDSAGNVVIVGTFAGKMSLGGPDLTSIGGFDIFVAKLDSAGKHVWSKSFGAAMDQSANAVAIDAAGNVIVTGDFRGAVDFGGGALPNAGVEDIFVLKLDSAGKQVWSKGFGDAGFQSGRSVAIDASSNITLLATVEGATNFGGAPLTSAGLTDVAIAKLNPGGNHLYSKIFGGPGNDAAGELALDAKGNVTATGSFTQSISFGGAPLTSAGGNDVFAVRFTDAGIHLWSRGFGDAGDQTGRALDVDAAGNVFLTGAFLSSIDFGGGPLMSAGSEDIFVAKLDAAGAHVWSKSYGDGSQQGGRGIAVDGAGNVLVTGALAGSADFGAGPLVSAGLADVLFLKLGADGVPLLSRVYGDADDQTGRAIAADAKGSILLGGQFKGSLALGNVSLTATGSYDAFIAKLAP